MGFRYQKRVNLGDGAGLNISKSGISPSVRSQFGTFGTRGFSIRTGIPGLTWRGGTGKNTAAIWLLFMMVTGLVLVIYNLIRLLLFLIAFAIQAVFTKEGINYLNLGIVFAIIAAIVLILNVLINN